MIEPDETAAIVGHTGAGKTTITSLMMRFYDIQRGSILVDGVDVREQNLKKLRQRFGVVLQDPFLFSGTISDNIRLGSTWITDDRLERAATRSISRDFIRTLPLKLRRARARARRHALHRSETAHQLRSRPGPRPWHPRPRRSYLVRRHRHRTSRTPRPFARMITGRTSILIAHRLSTIQRADTILVMHKGQLREKGTHQQLLTQRGLYWKLYELQYKDQETGTGSDASTPLEPLSAD